MYLLHCLAGRFSSHWHHLTSRFHEAQKDQMARAPVFILWDGPHPTEGCQHSSIIDISMTMNPCTININIYVVCTCIYIYIYVIYLVLICTVYILYICVIMRRFDHSKRHGPGPCDHRSMEVHIAVQVAFGPGAGSLFVMFHRKDTWNFRVQYNYYTHFSKQFNRSIVGWHENGGSRISVEAQRR